VINGTFVREIDTSGICKRPVVAIAVAEQEIFLVERPGRIVVVDLHNGHMLRAFTALLGVYKDPHDIRHIIASNGTLFLTDKVGWDHYPCAEINRACVCCS
jgi:hypothetical protein